MSLLDHKYTYYIYRHHWRLSTLYYSFESKPSNMQLGELVGERWSKIFSSCYIGPGIEHRTTKCSGWHSHQAMMTPPLTHTHTHTHTNTHKHCLHTIRPSY